MLLEQFRQDQSKIRKRTIIIYLAGIILIIIIPFISVFIIKTIYFKPPAILSKIDNVQKISNPEINSFITIYLISENEFCCPIHKGKKTKFITLKRDEIEKIIRRFPYEIYFIKACKTARYNDLEYVIVLLSTNKIKTYAIVDLQESDIIALEKIQKMKH